jgi:bifunctional non-homologous end joining protein LigD
MDSIAELNVQDTTIEEIVALDEKGRSSFQLLQAYDIGQQRPPIFFFCIRSAATKRQDLKKLSLEERKAILQKLINRDPGRNSLFRGSGK